MKYSDFISSKLQIHEPVGIDGATVDSEHLFDFQRDVVAWALRRGRCAIFADTGLGKSRMQLTWAQRVHEHTGKPVLILAPLAVAEQTAEEGQRIGIDVTVCREQSDLSPGLNITNYERVHKFDASVFGGVVLDESSIIKHHTAKTLQTMLDMFARTPFRLACTATPSPNDYTELGTHAEFLGICTRTEMLSEYFCHDGGETQNWRLKGHARQLFWRFVSSWGALIRSPRDLGYSADGYDLPPLSVQHHTIEASDESVAASGLLFAEPAQSLMERRNARKASLSSRVESCVELVCRGSLSTQRTEERKQSATTNIGTVEISSLQKTKTKRKLTSGLTTQITKTSSREAAPSKTKPTLEGGFDTQPTLNTEIGISQPSEPTNAPTPGSDSGCASSGSPLNSTTKCSPRREADAPSAGEHPTNADGDGFTSTTATSPELSGAFSVHHAILDSASLKMTTTASSEQWVIWCELNSEQDALESMLGSDCVSIFGTLDADEKVARYRKWQRGEARILITKPSIFGFGCNMQHCANMAFVGVTDSWEAYYQAVRRCYRFGQKRPVNVHIFASELEGNVIRNLQRKESDARAMADELSREAKDAVMASIRGSARVTNSYSANRRMKTPAWLVTSMEGAF